MAARRSWPGSGGAWRPRAATAPSPAWRPSPPPPSSPRLSSRAGRGSVQMEGTFRVLYGRHWVQIGSESVGAVSDNTTRLLRLTATFQPGNVQLQGLVKISASGAKARTFCIAAASLLVGDLTSWTVLGPGPDGDPGQFVWQQFRLSSSSCSVCNSAIPLRLSVTPVPLLDSQTDLLLFLG